MLLGSDTMKISAQRIKRKKQLEKKRAELEEKRKEKEAIKAALHKKHAGATAAAEAARAALAKEQTAHEKTMARLAMMEDALAAAGIELDDEEHRGAHADAPA